MPLWLQTKIPLKKTLVGTWGSCGNSRGTGWDGHVGSVTRVNSGPVVTENYDGFVLLHTWKRRSSRARPGPVYCRCLLPLSSSLACSTARTHAPTHTSDDNSFRAPISSPPSCSHEDRGERMSKQQRTGSSRSSCRRL